MISTKIQTRKVLASMVDNCVPIISHAVICLALKSPMQHAGTYAKMMNYYRPSQSGHESRLILLLRSYLTGYDLKSNPISLDSRNIPIDGNHRFSYALASGIETLRVYPAKREKSKQETPEELLEKYGFTANEKRAALAEMRRIFKQWNP